MTDLTEQWKKGELNRDEVYYYETPFYTVDTASGYWLCNHLDTKKDKVKVLDQVPSYEEWKAKNEENKQLKIWCEEFNALDVAKENAKLKELLKRAETQIIAYKNNDTLPERAFYEKEVEELLGKIDEVLNA